MLPGMDRVRQRGRQPGGVADGVLRVIRRECRTSLGELRLLTCPANERLPHAHPAAGMLTAAAPSGRGGTPAAVTNGGAGADMRRASSRRYLESESGCLRCKRRGCFVCISCVVDALPGQCLRRMPGTNPLVAAVFKTKRLLREHCSATCQRRRRPGQARHRQGRLQITADRRADQRMTMPSEMTPDQADLACGGGRTDWCERLHSESTAARSRIEEGL